MPKKRKPATPRRPAPKPLPEPLPPNPPPIPVRVTSTIPAHLYEVRPRKDKHGVDLISDALPFGRLWYGEPNAVGNAIRYAILLGFFLKLLNNTLKFPQDFGI
jgi:hypothetical protein